MPSIESSRQATVRRSTKGVNQTQWFINEVSEEVVITLRQRMGIAVGFLKNKITRQPKRLKVQQPRATPWVCVS